MASQEGLQQLMLSVVVPAYNEKDVLEAFHQRLHGVLCELPLRSEVVYVNDGSTDDTVGVVERLRQQYDNIALLDLSRNFGKEIALTAGLDHAQGDAVVVIDADLQDPPELIPQLVAEWNRGYDVVFAQRIRRDGETAFKKLTAHLFYRFLARLSDRVEIPRDTGDFRLLSRRAVDALARLREQHRFMKGLFAWIGFRQKSVPYTRDPRFAGTTKWNYWKLWNLSIEGITSFSIAPLKLATYLGLIAATGSLAYALFVVYKTLAFGDPVAGFPTLATLIGFIGGVQLATLGLIGEYLGRVFNETKGRPLYFVQRFEPAAPQPTMINQQDLAAQRSLERSISPT